MYACEKSTLKGLKLRTSVLLMPNAIKTSSILSQSPLQSAWWIETLLSPPTALTTYPPHPNCPPHPVTSPITYTLVPLPLPVHLVAEFGEEVVNLFHHLTQLPSQLPHLTPLQLPAPHDDTTFLHLLHHLPGQLEVNCLLGEREGESESEMTVLHFSLCSERERERVHFVCYYVRGKMI